MSLCILTGHRWAKFTAPNGPCEGQEFMLCHACGKCIPVEEFKKTEQLEEVVEET